MWTGHAQYSKLLAATKTIIIVVYCYSGLHCCLSTVLLFLFVCCCYQYTVPYGVSTLTHLGTSCSRTTPTHTHTPPTPFIHPHPHTLCLFSHTNTPSHTHTPPPLFTHLLACDESFNKQFGIHFSTNSPPTHCCRVRYPRIGSDTPGCEGEGVKPDWPVYIMDKPI